MRRPQNKSRNLVEINFLNFASSKEKLQNFWANSRKINVVFIQMKLPFHIIPIAWAPFWVLVLAKEKDRF